MSRVPKIRSLRQWRFALLTAVLVAAVAASGAMVGQRSEVAFAAEDENVAEPQPTIVIAPEDPVVSSDATDAVSYTHLDVYKRQHPQRLSG